MAQKSKSNRAVMLALCIGAVVLGLFNVFGGGEEAASGAVLVMSWIFLIASAVGVVFYAIALIGKPPPSP